uniref:Tll0287-like domain-containing protein n=1 Tax=Candidatus Kentrum sp. TUN TaxID=2126343 RepID=A0A450ZIA1_9GAMM|nr:MAG: Protein of unknown function (DUF3365) [Candidatus Kentron sp. TUN]VFK52935.1 MAG: Protein of unknown function (DUF3365) [Candidatus Kentron sp. TUN]VFK53499.1 MAG: Protein of unknown function (DUF3365) [Candidatus Kentron sp. TUN]
MKKISLLFLLFVVGCSGVPVDNTEERVIENRLVVKDLFAALKGELEKALQAGGPASAISVCKTKVPEIGKTFKERYPGWTIGRTSLKTRNPANAPDEWETGVLQKFEVRKAAGEDPKTMEYSAFVEKDGIRAFRYMKAIPTSEVCTLCHGRVLIPNVIAKLDELYPEDQARGFDVGDIRGAFSITQPESAGSHHHPDRTL